MALADTGDAAVVMPVVSAPPDAPPVPEAGLVEGRASEEHVFVASQWQLMWWRFRKHKVAIASAVLILISYMVVIFAEFFAYADPYASAADAPATPDPAPVRRRSLGAVRLWHQRRA
jgi:hypothetical protein